MWFLRRSNYNAESQSQEALDDAESNLSEIKKRSFEVRQISNALKDIRERNHFAEQFEEILLRNGGSLNHDPQR
jgi:hypothetical protein